MTNPNRKFFRRIYLLKEMDVSISTVESGLAILQKSQGMSNHFAFLILLSTGLERLMKIVLSLHRFKSSGKFLSNTELRALSHKLGDLRHRIIGDCFTPQYLTNPMAQDDLDFLKNDKLLDKMMGVLSDFAQRDRYIYLNGIDEPEKVGPTPEGRWDQLKTNVTQSTEALVICTERLVRALARIVAFGALENEAQVYSPSLHETISIFTSWHSSMVDTVGESYGVHNTSP